MQACRQAPGHCAATVRRLAAEPQPAGAAQPRRRQRHARAGRPCRQARTAGVCGRGGAADSAHACRLWLPFWLGPAVPAGGVGRVRAAQMKTLRAQVEMRVCNSAGAVELGHKAPLSSCIPLRCAVRQAGHGCPPTPSPALAGALPTPHAGLWHHPQECLGAGGGQLPA